MLGAPLNLSGNAPGKDQDPTFSAPDGTQIVFAHVDPGPDGKVPAHPDAQSLRIADVSSTPDPRPLDFPSLPDYQSVPAWSRR